MNDNSGKAAGERIKQEMFEEINGLNNTEKVYRLKELFQCRPNPKNPPDRHGFIMIKRGILNNRTAEIINKCRFYRDDEVDLDHILEFCCNEFKKCPFYIKFKQSQKELENFQRPFNQ